MTTRQQIFAAGIRESRVLLNRYLKGFDDTNHTKQAQNLPNHFAWIMGHLALTMHRCAEKLDRKPMPETDFLKGDGKGGNAQRFDTESVCFGSKPVSDAAIYPTAARCVAILDAAVERMAQAAESADDALLDSPTRWGQMEVPLCTLLPRMVFHNGTHCGQLADLRRALGMASVFG